MKHFAWSPIYLEIIIDDLVHTEYVFLILYSNQCKSLCWQANKSHEIKRFQIASIVVPRLVKVLGLDLLENVCMRLCCGQTRKTGSHF